MLKSGQTSRQVDGNEDALMRILNGDPLPAVVTPLGVEQALYVATWRTGTWCAVLSVTRDEHDDGREPPYSQDLDVYEHVEGAWVWRAGGGSSWPVNVGDAPSITELAVTGFAFGMPAEMDERERWLVSGIAPPGWAALQSQFRAVRAWWGLNRRVEPSCSRPPPAMCSLSSSDPPHDRPPSGGAGRAGRVMRRWTNPLFTGICATRDDDVHRRLPVQRSEGFSRRERLSRTRDGFRDGIWSARWCVDQRCF